MTNTVPDSSKRALIFLLLSAVVVVYLIMAALFAIKTPPWQVPDEPAHYHYIAQLAQSGAIPVLQVGDWDSAYLETIKGAKFAPEVLTDQFNLIRYEDSQPPLYYLLQTPVYWLTNGSIIAMRLFSALLGAGVVIVAFAVIFTLFPAQPYLALATAIFVALLPQHLAMLAGVENDSLAELLIGLTIWACLLYLGNRPTVHHANNTTDQTIHPGWIGSLLGLALVTKVTAYLLIGIVTLALVLRALRERPSLRRFSRDCAWVVLPALTFGGVWWLHSIQMYGFPDFLGLGRHNSVVVGQLRTSDYINQNGLSNTLSSGLQTTFHSFWGQFGWMGLVLPGWIYTILVILTVLTVIGAGIALVRFRRALPGAMNAARRDGVLLLVALALLALAEIVYYNLSFVQFQGRYLYPGLIAIAFFFVVGIMGWLSLVRIRRAHWLVLLMLPAFVIFDLYSVYLIMHQL
jgi:4-amino-4-deoxy-L-arabinose transferase-like glycosyltransferase